MKLTESQMDEFRALHDELRELERDRDRLDWLEKDGSVRNTGVSKWVAWGSDMKSFSGKTVRAAIDAAMNK